MRSAVNAIDHNPLVRVPLLALGFLVAYLLLDQISFIHHLRELNITPWNPQPALAVALVFLLGRRWVVWVFVTMLAAEFVVRDLSVPLANALVLTAILTCGYAGIAWLLSAPFGIAPDLESRKDVLHLTAAVVLGAGVTSFLYISALRVGGFLARGDYQDALFRFWIGDAIGMLVTLPLLLLLADARRRRELWALANKREVLLQVAAVVAMLALVFARGDEGEQFKYFYLLFLPLIWVAARHGLAGAIVVVAIIQAGVIISVVIKDHETLTVFELQSLLLSLVLTGLFLGAAVDEWRLASERLARAHQLTVAGEMATALAHELNQPLTALTTYADAIRLQVEAPRGDAAPLIDTAERMRRVARRCADIVGRFRGLETVCERPSERILITEPLRAAIEALGERTARANVVFDVSVPGDLPPLPLDRERITFVLQSLLANAVDAVQTLPAVDRRIAVVARRDGRKHVTLTVRDAGSGISPERVDKIFEPFYSGKAQGMGLGLAISRSIVESHGGRLWAEPANHGLFHVRLPL